jgi:tetratricopeptide (TPR) repeat protein
MPDRGCRLPKRFSVPFVAAVIMSLAGSGIAGAEDSSQELKLARDYFRDGRFAECLRVLQHQPENRRDAEVLNMMGASLAKLGKNEDAERNFRGAISRYPHHLAAYHNLGQLYIERHLHAQAIAVLKDGLSVFPKSEHLLRALGTVYQLSGHLQDAHATFERWVQLWPESDEAYAMLGDSYLESGEYGPAVTNLRRSAELSPRSPRVQYLLALAHSYLGQVTESQACLRRVLELDPAFCLAYYQLAKEELDNNEPLAFELLKKATVCDPTQPQSHYQLSRIYSRRGKSALADQEMRLFLKYRLQSPTKGMVSRSRP